MSNPNPGPGRRFKPGQSGNPKGAAAHNKDVKRIRRMTADEVAQMGSLILEGNLAGLVAVKDDKDASVLKVWMASVAIKAINKGDAQALGALLDRITGRLTQPIELGGIPGQPIETRSKVDLGPLIADPEAQQLLERLADKLGEKHG
jgi:hypothetical protein